MTSLTIAATAKGFPVSLKINKPVDIATVADVKAALAVKLPRVWSSYALTRVFVSPHIRNAFLQLYVERQKLSLKGDVKALDNDAVLAAAGVRDGGELVLKDLGPQVSWKTVFLVEYVRLLVLSLSRALTEKNNTGWPTRHSSDFVSSA
jgi:very-long-chain enoyl-CoA reductase